MSEIAEFPLPSDATDEERATASREIGKRTKITEEKPNRVMFEGRQIGKTGPIWHMQYTRVYALPKGFLAAGHDLREGIFVAYADELHRLSAGIANDSVREFVEDELKFRGLLAKEHAA